MTDVTMSERIARVRLRVADHTEKQAAADEFERALLVLRKANDLADEIERQESQIVELVSEGVVVNALRDVDKRRATDAKRQLNTSATFLKDAERLVKSVVESKALEDALADVEIVVRARRERARAQAQTFIEQLRPADLADVNPNMISSSETRRVLVALQRCFEPAVEQPLHQLLTRVRAARSAVSEWDRHRHTIEAAIDGLPIEVKLFLTRVRLAPVNWNEVPPVVRQWLDQGTYGTGFQIKQVQV